MIVTALQNARAVKVAKLYQNIATSYDPNARIEVNNDKWLERCKEAFYPLTLTDHCL
jgi:hypothetical protein